MSYFQKKGEIMTVSKALDLKSLMSSEPVLGD